MILHALVDDAAAGGKILDAIRPAAERRLERGLADIAAFAVSIGSFPPMFWQDAELTDDLWQFAIARRVEHEGDLVVASFFRLGDVSVIGRKLWTVLPERIERKNHVVWRDRLAVVPFGLRPQPVGDRGEIGWKTYCFRHQAILARNLIKCGDRQGFVNKIDRRGERAFHPGDRGFKFVEWPYRILRGGPAFGRPIIKILNLLNPGGIFKSA